MSKYKPPSGVYFLYENGKVVYVGQTNDIFRRISEHARGGQKHGFPNKEFDDWSYIACEDAELREQLEALFIKFINPIYNMSQKPFCQQTAERSGWLVGEENKMDISPERAVAYLSTRVA